MSAPAYRIAPRRSRGGAPASRIDWERFGRIALVLVLFVIVALYVNPLMGFVDAWRDSKAESAQLTELRSENAQLRERAEALSEPEAAERGARRLGMVEPGELSVVIGKHD